MVSQQIHSILNGLKFKYMILCRSDSAINPLDGLQEIDPSFFHMKVYADFTFGAKADISISSTWS